MTLNEIKKSLSYPCVMIGFADWGEVDFSVTLNNSHDFERVINKIYEHESKNWDFWNDYDFDEKSDGDFYDAEGNDEHYFFSSYISVDDFIKNY